MNYVDQLVQIADTLVTHPRTMALALAWLILRVERVGRRLRNHSSRLHTLEVETGLRVEQPHPSSSS